MNVTICIDFERFYQIEAQRLDWPMAFSKQQAYPSSGQLIHLDIKVPRTRSHGFGFNFRGALGGDIVRVGNFGGLRNGGRLDLDSGIRRTGVGAHDIGKGRLM